MPLMLMLYMPPQPVTSPPPGGPLQLQASAELVLEMTLKAEEERAAAAEAAERAAAAEAAERAAAAGAVARHSSGAAPDSAAGGAG